MCSKFFEIHLNPEDAEKISYLFSQSARLYQILTPSADTKESYIKSYCSLAQTHLTSLTQDKNIIVLPSTGYFFQYHSTKLLVESLLNDFPLSKILDKSLTNWDRWDIIATKLENFIYCCTITIPLGFVKFLSSAFIPAPIESKPCALSAAATSIKQLNEGKVKTHQIT